MTDHPIIPPPKLVQQWLDEFYDSPTAPGESTTHVATRAAAWGADTELEACCKLLELSDDSACEYLRAARRPPASLKEQACSELVDAYNAGQIDDSTYDILRLALEALSDD